MTGRVLIVAGSDSGAGAGIQADLKTVMALGGYATTAITALTAQNTHGVHGVHGVPPDFVRRQITVVLEDIGADAIKIGMLGDEAMIEAVADALAPAADRCPLVVDPVMVAKGGAPLLAAGAAASLRHRLIPLAALVTPNLPEARALTGSAEPQRAADALLALGASAVLIKGGHGSGEIIDDWLITPSGSRCFSQERIHTRHTHGTGCTLASAIASGLALGLSMEPAVEQAIEYVRAAILAAPGLGQGHGPLGHGCARLTKARS